MQQERAGTGTGCSQHVMAWTWQSGSAGGAVAGIGSTITPPTGAGGKRSIDAHHGSRHEQATSVRKGTMLLA